MHWIASLVALLAVFGASPASAQAYPTKPIHILVPYAPGGIADIAAQIIGAKMTEAWGQQVVVENRPGGNAFIAMGATAKAPPDGYTLVMATIGDVAINPALFKEMPYNVERDLAPIAQISDAPMVLAANGNSPYKTVADVIAAAKAQPGRISVATPGNGSVNQIVLEWLALNTDTKFQHIPYKGGAPAAAALAGSDIPRGARQFVDRAARQERARPHPGGDRRQALEVQSGMADPAEGRRQGGRCVELDRALCAQGHAAADHRQAQRRGGEDPQHAGRQGPLRGRRRRDPRIDPGRARGSRQGSRGALQDHRRQGQHQAELSVRRGVAPG